MDTSWSFVCLYVCFVRYVVCEADNVGPGIWSLINIAPCEASETNAMQSNMTKKRISREQDGFTGSINFGIALQENISMKADICVVLDGGCKPFMVMTDDSFCRFMKQHMPEFFVELLAHCGVEPADCPVEKGLYSVSDYPFNYTQLTSEAVYGKFETIARLFDGQTEVMCLNVITTFQKKEDR